MLKGRVHFALVGYRDQLENPEDQKQLEYVSRLYCDLPTGKDHQEFLRRLYQVKEASIGSQDSPEDALAGLKLAIDQAGWSQKASYKHILLIGDASVHKSLNSFKNVTKSTIPGILAMAQPTGSKGSGKCIQIHGLRVLGFDPNDRISCRKDFERITKGREFRGLHYEYSGAKDASKFVSNLTARLREMAGYTKHIASGDIEELVKQAKVADPGSDQSILLGPLVEAFGNAGSPPSRNGAPPLLRAFA